MNAQQTAADLLSAANHIEQFGWQRYRYGAAQRACCVRGAIQVAVYGWTWDEDHQLASTGDLNQREDDATDQVLWHLGKLGSLVGWNDAGDRTAAEVIETLRAAASRVFPDA